MASKPEWIEYSTEEIEELTEKDEMEEYCFLHLRMKEGIPLDDFEHRYGHPLSFWYGRQVAMLKKQKSRMPNKVGKER